LPAPLAKKKACKSSTYKPLEIWWRFRDSNPGPADYDSDRRTSLEAAPVLTMPGFAV